MMQFHIPAKVTPLNVPVLELPEYLYVDTHYVSAKYAIENNLQNIPKVSKFVAKLMDLTSGETPSVDISMPRRDRPVQTECVTVDVGIQCKLDELDELEVIESFPEPPIDPDARIKEEQKFLIFVSEHTSMFPNGMLECLICGEVAAALREHQQHMTAHHGPGVLCFRCGQQFSHQCLLKKHFFDCPARLVIKPQMRYKCPHFACNVVAISKRQLNAHMSKHRGVHYYRCSKCLLGFTSTDDFLVHRLVIKGCHRGQPIKSSRGYLQSKRKSDLRRCSVCIKRFSSAHICANHKIQCLRLHQQRVQKLLTKTKQ